jgi:hypothetical protein
MRCQPQHAGVHKRTKIGPVPLGRFTAMTMDLAMMSRAERYDELVADLAAERPALGEAQVMGVGGFAATDQTRLPRHKAHRCDAALDASIALQRFIGTD